MRTKKSIFNFIADVFPFFIIGFLNFIRVKYIIKYYGTDANGYMQLISQIFSYLALAEAGYFILGRIGRQKTGGDAQP